ncbi:hypothetical protein GCM10009107_12770 [Ideonella azotifigens]|uniref:Haemolysin-type calcium binding-related domain-containing protein n=1 Tax=Ideonella azotifigens TaxID=513160 RepID=A0ABN1JSL0_9BURK
MQNSDKVDAILNIAFGGIIDKDLTKSLVAVATKNPTTNKAWEPNLNGSDAKPLNDLLNATMLEYHKTHASSPSTFVLDVGQIQSVFNFLVPGFELDVNGFLSKYQVGNFDLTLEKLALMSLGWGGSKGASPANLLGPGLGQALKEGNRAEAWYQIRYGSNGGASPSGGVAARRYLESNIFGLYNGAQATEADAKQIEAKQIYGMLTQHRSEIFGYDAKWSVSPDGKVANGTNYLVGAQGNYDQIVKNANLELAGSGNLLPSGAVPTLVQALSLAYSSFVSYANRLHGANAPDVNQSVISNAAAIYFKADQTSVAQLDARVDDARSGNRLNNNLMVGGEKGDVIYGGTGLDYLLGQAGGDVLDGGADDDTLIGGLNNDTLKGGLGKDSYIFSTGDGLDSIVDQDGLGEIRIGGTALSGGTSVQHVLEGNFDAWVVDDFQYIYSLDNDHKTLVISGLALGDGNEITISNVDVDKLLGSAGYLGIKLQLEKKVDVQPGANSNPYAQTPAGSQTLAGPTADILERGGRSFTISLNSAAAAGDTLTLALTGGASGQFKAILGDSTVTANGAVITLAEGQTQVTFALIEDGDVTADSTSTLSVNYVSQGASVNSNSVAINLHDTGVISKTFNGDQRPANLTGANHDTYDWASTTWQANGTLTGGVTEVNFSDVIHGGSAAEQINGLGGNDALDGGAGNDRIDGGEGDDLIGGGTGSDYIQGGNGNDYISSSATLSTLQREKTTDDWNPPAGQQVITEGARWGIYLAGPYSSVWDGVNAPVGSDGDVVDGGAGNDNIMTSAGNDRATGGAGQDGIDGMGGDDILEGGDGMDALIGDYDINQVAGQYHGADFLDGGAGNDYLNGSGGNDQLFGGADTDLMYGDSDDNPDVGWAIRDVSFHGNDYLDGEDGDDRLFGGGKGDTLYGGAGGDTLWGDVSANLAKNYSDQTLLWGDDFLDGEDGVDILVGNGGEDSLYGGADNDSLWGDDPNLALEGRYQGKDYLDGEDGADQLVGGGGDDTLYGGTGSDAIWGDDNATYLDPQYNGDDYLDGEAGTDQLVGGGGNDTLIGGDDADIMLGDADDIAAEYHGTDNLDGGEGNDTLFGYGGDDTLLGGAGDDWLAGEDETDSSVVSAYSGNDWLDGGDGNDTLIGGNGNDTLIGGAGTNNLYGGAGDDLYILDVGDSVGESPASAQQAGAVATAGPSTPVGWDADFGAVAIPIAIPRAPQGVTVDSAVAQVHDKQIAVPDQSTRDVDGAGAQLSAAPNASAAPVNLIGDSGGNDTLQVNGDFAVADTDADGSLTLSLGDPAQGQYLTLRNAYFGAMTNLNIGGDSVLLRDWVQDKVTTNFTFSLDGAPVHQVFGAGGNDTIFGTYTTSAMEILDGGWGDDHIFGYGGADSLIGDEGNDYLDGGDGEDVLDGGAGNDTLMDYDGGDLFRGGTGNDSIYALGSSSYMFNLGDGNDTIGVGGTLPPVRDAPFSTLNFGSGIATSDISLSRSYRQYYDPDKDEWINGPIDLLIKIIPSGDSILVQNFSWNNDPFGVVTPQNPLQEIDFADGTIWSLAQICDLITAGTVGDDYIDGFSRPTIINGGLGNDTLVGHSSIGGDTLASGDGDDFLQGNGLLHGDAGNDSLGGGGYLYGDAGNDYLSNYSPESGYISATLDGGDGDDSFEIRGVPCTVIGGGGDDWLQAAGSVYTEGGTGEDTIFASNEQIIGFRRGDGADLIMYDGFSGSAGPAIFDILGISASDVKIRLAGTDDLVLDFGGLDRITIDSYFDANQSASYGIEIDGAEVQLLSSLIISGTFGADSMVGTAGDDVMSGSIDNDTLSGGAGNDGLQGGLGNDNLTGGDGADTLVGSLGSDRMLGGAGNDVYFVDESDAAVSENANAGLDTVHLVVAYAPKSTYTLASNVESLLLDEGTSQWLNGSGNDLANTVTGNSGSNSLAGGTGGNDTLFGLAGDDTLDGGTGTDSLVGGLGNDTYVVDVAGDIIVEQLNEGVDTVKAAISYTLTSNFENLTLLTSSAIDGVGNLNANVLTGNSSANSLSGADGNDTLVGAGGADTLLGGLGDDVFVWDSGTVSLIENSGEGADTLQSSLTVTQLADNVENLVLTGAGIISATGNTLANRITGNGADNALYGAGGDDTLDGGAGSDAMYGGLGNDVYVIDSANDSANETSGQGIDTIQTAVNLQGSLASEVENLVLLGSEALNGTGNGLANALTGNSASNTLTGAAGNDTLDGGAGADSLVGGTGNDLYVLDDAGDLVTENSGEGTDTVQSYVSVAGLFANVENLTLLGSDGLSGVGNGLNNQLIGNLAGNTLDGGAGNDIMKGGAGDDVYLVDSASDAVTEISGEGTDTVQTTVSLLAALANNVENITVLGSNALQVTGNTLANVLTGNVANDTLMGGNGNDTLDGGAGVDSLVGGGGNDVYMVDTTGDVVAEDASAGTDTIRTTVTLSSLITNMENLELLGDQALSGTGNDSANRLTGNYANNVLTGLAGNDTLDGGAGADSLVGGAGNDVYVVDDYGDVVTENASEGTDTIQTYVTLSNLAANIENVLLLGNNWLSVTGNTLKNTLTGNAAANTLDGGAGNDAMLGGAGDDVYVVDSTSDVVTENLNEGLDTIQTTVTLLGNLVSNVENLVLLGSSLLSATGNELDNQLVGNSANNTLSGGAGNDTLDGGAGADNMSGGDGNDTYVVDSADDLVTEAAGAGTDTVQTSVQLGALSGTVENLVLLGANALNATGNDLANLLVGNSAANVLDGGLGSDVLQGGAGDDVYLVDATGDLVTENQGEGVDTIQTSVALQGNLVSNVENLVLLGSAGLSATGNELGNWLTGNSAGNLLTALDGNDTLDGGAGVDTMRGGVGDDVYFVDTATMGNTPGDVVTENSGEGTDTIRTTVSLTGLANNVENLTMLGTNALSAIGNGLANVMTGNSANDTLTGAGGNDTLDGGAGMDSLAGGGGNDVYVIDDAGDSVSEDASAGTDTVQTYVSVSLLGPNVENLVLLGIGDLSGTGNDLNNQLTGNAGANALSGAAGNDTLDGGSGADRMSGGAGNDVYVVDGVADVVTEDASAGTDTIQTTVTLSGLATNVENLMLLGTDALNGTGNTLKNLLTGNTAANTLTGNEGADTLVGGLGNDYLIGGTGNDTYRFAVGDGQDLLSDSDSTAGNSDWLEFGTGINASTVLVSRVGNDMVIKSKTGTDSVTMTGWYNGTAYKVENARWGDGTTSTAAQLEAAAAGSGSLAIAPGTPEVGIDAFDADEPWIGRKFWGGAVRHALVRRDTTSAGVDTQVPSVPAVGMLSPVLVAWHGLNAKMALWGERVDLMEDVTGADGSAGSPQWAGAALGGGDANDAAMASRKHRPNAPSPRRDELMGWL